MTFASARRIVWPAGALLAASALVLGAACFHPVAAPPDARAAAPDKADAPSAAAPGDCPMFGRTVERNLANPVEKNILDTWSVKKKKPEQNVKWKAVLGNSAFGGPTIAGGRVFVGTNNAKPRDPAVDGDKGVVMCFNEADGAFLWQLVHDKEATAIDASGVGVASTPAVDGDRLYYVSNRCELVCADVAGDPAAKGKGKIVWSLDMIKDLKVYPGGLEGGLANCSPLVLDDLVYVVTSNGVDMNTDKPPAPDAPSFLAVHKDNGKVAWSSNLPGANIMDGQWSNPVAAEVNGVKQVIFPGGDGWLYGFEATKGDLLWKFDCNPKKSDFKPPTGEGTRNYLVATPVVVDGKLYVGVGREPDAGPGVGHLWCIDLTKKPANKDKDLSPVNDNFDPKDPVNKDSGLVWHFGGAVAPKPAAGEREYVFGRTVSTCAVHDGLVYAADLEGFLYCLDAKTGDKVWQHDIGGATWSSPYYVDGKVFMGVDNGDLLVLAAGKVDKLLNKVEMGPPMKVPPVAANGVLYVNNGAVLYAIGAK